MEWFMSVQGLIIAYVAGGLTAPALLKIIKAALDRAVNKND